MNINIAQISEDEGLNIEHVYPEGEPRLESEDGRITGRPVIMIQATRAGAEVRLVGDLKADVQFDCDRCLAPTAIPVAQSFDLLYVPAAKPGADDEKELGDDDLSIAFYQGDIIDVDELVREQVELALPMARVCDEQCRGLCPECGGNLNQAECSCAVEAADPRWATLRNLKSDIQ